MVTKTGELAAKRDAAAGIMITSTRSLIEEACSQYKPSRLDPVICRSGEDNGKPFRGRTCGNCTVGQFSSNLVFCGEITKGKPTRRFVPDEPLMPAVDATGCEAGS